MPNHRFDLAAFYAAIDMVRANHGLTWRDVAQESGLSASTLTRLSQGRSVSLDGMASLIGWADLNANLFVRDRTVSRDPWLRQLAEDAANWRALVGALGKLLPEGRGE